MSDAHVPSRAHGSGGAQRSSVASRLLALFTEHHLSRAHRLVARYLVDHAPESVFLSSAALAEQSGVSQPSVIRLAQALGFSGYTDLQRHLRSLIIVDQGPDDATASTNRFQAAARESIHTLEALESLLGAPAEVAALGRELARSHPMVVLSVRASAPVASYFAYFAARVHADVRLLSAGGSEVLDRLAQARQAGAQWLVCFLLPRYPHEILDALEYARELGYQIAIVTDQASDVARDLSDVLLMAGVGERLAFPTYAAPLLLAGVLLQALCDATPRRTRARLEEYERMVEERRVFL
jgi:DNA-binding MurR/RpiR family transcriptional regulator